MSCNTATAKARASGSTIPSGRRAFVREVRGKLLRSRTHEWNGPVDQFGGHASGGPGYRDGVRPRAAEDGHRNAPHTDLLLAVVDRVPALADLPDLGEQRV